MKIGIDTHHLDKPQTSGPGIYQKHLIRGLQKVEGLKTFLIHHKQFVSDIYDEANEVIVPKLPYLGEQKLNSLNLDLVHFNRIPWAWRILFHTLTCKKIVTVHGDEYWTIPKYAYHPLWAPLKKIVEPRTIHACDRVITVSKSLKHSINRFLHYPQEKIKVIYPGIDHSFFYPRPNHEVNQVREKYGLNSPYILHISACAKKKNPQGLLKSFALISQQKREITLVIGGPRWKTSQWVRKTIQTLGLEERVKLLGWIEKDDLPALYTGADVFFSPTFHETFGFPNVEAMACGTSIVSSDVYAVPEVVDNAGILCNPKNYQAFADSILKLLQNPSLTKRLETKGIKNANRFTWDKTIQATREVYAHVIN